MAKSQIQLQSNVTIKHRATTRDFQDRANFEKSEPI